MAHHMPLLAQFLSHCPCALSGPAQGRLRIPPGGRFDQGLQRREEGRVVLLDEMPASPGARTRSGAKSSRCWSSRRPAVIVVRDRPVASATRLTPPRPNDWASQAAH